MNSRERLKKTLNHENPGDVVVDMGSTLVTGISASALSKLRRKLGLEERLVKVHEPFQVLGEVEDDVRKELGIDVVSICSPFNMFGFKNEKWKPWILTDGTKVQIGEKFAVKIMDDGNTYFYPNGNLNGKPSAKMPKGGFYFDNIVRQEPIIEDNLNARTDFVEDYKIFSDDSLKYIEDQANYYFYNTNYGLNGGNFLAGFGDFAPLSGPGLGNPKGIRDAEEWLVAHYTLPNYIKEVYDFQSEIAIKNLELYKQAVGDKIDVIQVSGTDFGTQRAEFISPDLYREFYKPYHRKINDWVHNNTNWKTFYHTCGSVVNLLDDFVDSGMDIMNPVQCSASGMDPKFLKDKYGKRLTFWGGGIDTQKTLPFGTPDEVRNETLERLKIFAPGGGFVFNTIHNIQHSTTVENIIAMFDAIKEFNKNSKQSEI